MLSDFCQFHQITDRILFSMQVRFIADTRLSTDDRASLEKDCWTVPASYLTSANLDYEDYLAKGYITCDSYLEITLENFTEDMFFLINIRAFGKYIIVNYFPRSALSRPTSSCMT